MALTRKFLAALDIEGNKIDQIIDAHTETVDGLKAQLADAKESGDKLAKVQKELDDYKQDVKDNYVKKSDYDKLDGEFKSYKAEVSGKEAAVAKEKAVRAYFEGKNIKGANLEIAMRGAKDEISKVELDGDKIKDSKSLDELVGGTFAGLVSTSKTSGASTGNPPANAGGSSAMTKEQIYAIKDVEARQKAILDNIDLFN